MSHILALARRIKTIETIRKTTNAMRIITMASLHSLQRASRQFEVYAQQVAQLARTGGYSSSPTSPSAPGPLQRRTLLLAIGSQKGLCGTFNTELSRLFLKNHQPETLRAALGSTVDVVIIGRQLVTALENKGVLGTASYPTFSLEQVEPITRELVDMVVNAPVPYDEIVIYAQYPHSMMVQRPQITTLTPRLYQSEDQSDRVTYEQTPELLNERIRVLLLHSSLYGALLSSLAAEHAARFFSMDSASRNADEMLDRMRIDYNKLRQSLITKELNDLIGGSL